MVHKADVALIHGGLDKSRSQDIMWLLQEDPATMEKYLHDVSPQYLVGTTQLIGMGYTLTKVKRLVQLDPEWMERDELQARKRTNHITQHEETHSYSLRCPESRVEVMIFD